MTQILNLLVEVVELLARRPVEQGVNDLHPLVLLPLRSRARQLLEEALGGYGGS